MRRAGPENPVSANLLGNLNGDTALAFVHVDDRYHGDHCQNAENQQRTNVQTAREALQNLTGQSGDDAAKDDDRHARPDAGAGPES
jgi:hypothetical protein